MPKRVEHKATGPQGLKGWQQIASFLGEPISVVQRWASEGMPVHRQGRFITTSPNELNAWMAKESGKPVHVVTEESDLSAELRRGISFLKPKRSKSGSAA
jgi:hypothetical protein